MVLKSILHDISTLKRNVNTVNTNSLLSFADWITPLSRFTSSAVKALQSVTPGLYCIIRKAQTCPPHFLKPIVQPLFWICSELKLCSPKHFTLTTFFDENESFDEPLLHFKLFKSKSENGSIQFCSDYLGFI